MRRRRSRRGERGWAGSRARHEEWRGARLCDAHAYSWTRVLPRRPLRSFCCGDQSGHGVPAMCSLARGVVHAAQCTMQRALAPTKGVLTTRSKSGSSIRCDSKSIVVRARPGGIRSNT
eukprot:9204755-Pyramimonas_sp.AAC.1